MEITISVKEDTKPVTTTNLNKDKKTTAVKTKTVTTVKKEEDSAVESDYTRTPETKRKQLFTETITIKKEFIDDSGVSKPGKEQVDGGVESPTKLKPGDKSPKHPKKCIATKTINLSTKDTIRSEHLEDVVVDVQKSKSSREPSPDRIVPVPLSPEEEKNLNIPNRFPDKVIEPDDVKPQPKPIIKNIPIFEEQEHDFVGVKITEVDDNTIDVHQVSFTAYQTELQSDDDVSNLSVSQKVNRFISEAERSKDSPVRSVPIPGTPDFEERRKRFIAEKIVEEASESETETVVKKTSKSVTEIRKSVSREPEPRPHVISITVGAKTPSPDKQTPAKTSKVQPAQDQSEPESDRCYLNERPKNVTPKSASLVRNVARKISDQFEKDYYAKPEERPTVRQQSPGVSLKSTEVVKRAKAIFETKSSPTGTSPSKPRDIYNRPKTVVDGKKPREPVREEEVTQKNITLVEAYEEKIVPKAAYKTFKKDQTPDRKPERQSSVYSLEDDIIPIRDSNELIAASRPYSQTPEREPAKKTIETTEKVTKVTKTSTARAPTTTSTTTKKFTTDTFGSTSSSRRQTESSSSRVTSKTTTKQTDSDTRSNNTSRRGSNPNSSNTSNSRPGRDKTDNGPSNPRQPSGSSNRPSRGGAGGNPSSGNPNPNGGGPGKKQSPSYLRDTVSSKKDIFEKKITSTHTDVFERRKSTSPMIDDLPTPVYNTKEHSANVEYERSSSRDVPSFMSPTVSSLVHSNRKFSIETHVKQVQNVVEEDERVETIATVKSPTKDPKRPITFETTKKTPTRKGSTEVPCIEEIYDLELLERMLETVVGYEQRRRIRSQIRLVKKFMQEGKLVTKYRRGSDNPDTIEIHHTVKKSIPAEKTNTKTITTTSKVESMRLKAAERPEVTKKESTMVTQFSTKTPVKKTVESKTVTSRETSKVTGKTTKSSISSRQEYGVTPAFEDGLPLFGLRALKKRDTPSIVQSKGKF